MHTEQEVVFAIKCLFMCEETGCRMATIIIRDIINSPAAFRALQMALGFGVNDILRKDLCIGWDAERSTLHCSSVAFFCSQPFS